MMDTDIASCIMRRSNEAVLVRLRETAVADVCVSVVTKAELLYGVELSPKRRRDEEALREFLSYVEVLDLPDGAATDYAEIRAGLKREGAMISANDLWIAAHARRLGISLVTNNVREFGRVEGLKLENWTEVRP